MARQGGETSSKGRRRPLGARAANRPGRTAQQKDGMRERCFCTGGGGLAEFKRTLGDGSAATVGGIAAAGAGRLAPPRHVYFQFRTQGDVLAEGLKRHEEAAAGSPGCRKFLTEGLEA